MRKFTIEAFNLKGLMGALVCPSFSLKIRKELTTCPYVACLLQTHFCGSTQETKNKQHHKDDVSKFGWLSLRKDQILPDMNKLWSHEDDNSTP